MGGYRRRVTWKQLKCDKTIMTQIGSHTVLITGGAKGMLMDAYKTLDTNLEPLVSGIPLLYYAPSRTP